MRVLAPRPLLAAFFVVSLVTSAAWAQRSDRGLLDFGSFYMSGVLYKQGLDPHGVYPDLAEASGYEFGHDDDRGHSPNLNPPISVYPFRLLADVNANDAKAALNYVSVAVFAASAWLLLRAYPRQRTPMVALWLLALGAFWYTLWLGQIYVLLFALVLGPWFLLQRGANPLLAGALLGVVVAAKPNFALWPLFLLLAGYPKPALGAFAMAALISAVPLALDGPSIYEQWLEAARDYPRIGLSYNTSLVGEAERLGVPAIGYALSGALVLAAAAFIWRTKPPRQVTSAWAIVVALLATPISWLGYGLFALPVLLSRSWGRWEWAAAIGLVGLWHGLGLGEPYLLAMLLLLGLLARDALLARETTITAADVEPPAAGQPTAA